MGGCGAENQAFMLGLWAENENNSLYQTLNTSQNTEECRISTAWVGLVVGPLAVSLFYQSFLISAGLMCVIFAF